MDFPMDLHKTRPGGTTTQVQMLTRYKAWANVLTFKTVMQLPKDELVKERKTNFKSIIHTLNHVYVVDDVFKAHLTGQTHPYTSRNTDHPPAIETLWQTTRLMDDWYVELSDRLSADDLQEVIEFTFVGGGDGAMTREQILLHIVNHGTYHRGFVSDMLHQTPARFGSNDLPVFLRDIWSKNA
ncbi:MAG: damage-inducible protein DinB [bacterium]|nr:damage-inducible protein DinB [bacterium]